MKKTIDYRPIKFKDLSRTPRVPNKYAGDSMLHRSYDVPKETPDWDIDTGIMPIEAGYWMSYSAYISGIKVGICLLGVPALILGAVVIYLLA